MRGRARYVRYDGFYVERLELASDLGKRVLAVFGFLGDEGEGQDYWLPSNA